MTNPNSTLGARASGLADQALEATNQAAESTRRFAAGAAGRMNETVRDLGEGAAGLARTGAEAVGDATVAAQRQLGRLAREARSQAERQPLKTTLIAAGVLAAATALVLAITRSKR